MMTAAQAWTGTDILGGIKNVGQSVWHGLFN
jgi:hypothetical protein